MTAKRKISVLFICLGNICRSPAAQGIMQHLVDSQGLSSRFYIDSAGEGSWHVGQLPDARMRRHGQLRGYTFDHRARQFKAQADFARFDFIVTMDEANYADIVSMARTDAERRKVLRMSSFFKRYKGKDSVPDPYYGDASDFNLALDLIEDGCSELLRHLVNLHYS